MVVHNTISQLRQNAHLSQEEFAELFRVSRQSVQKWENGLAKPELEKLVDIANYFGVSLDSLIYGGFGGFGGGMNNSMNSTGGMFNNFR